MENKYVLIVSQYYHSRHSYIVKYDRDTFATNARKFIEELERYKRNPDDERPINYSDLSEEWYSPNKQRYNINDAGDIYFILSPYANYCKCEAIKYYEDSQMQSTGYKKKYITEAISNHHSLNTFRDILERHFEIA